MKKSRYFAILMTMLLLVSLILAACGGDDEDEKEENKEESATTEVVEPAATEDMEAEATEEAMTEDMEMEATEEAMTEDMEAEATEEAMTEDMEMEATEEAMTEDMEAEATEEAMTEDMEAEATEEAMTEDMEAEATEEAMTEDMEAEATEEAMTEDMEMEATEEAMTEDMEMEATEEAMTEDMEAEAAEEEVAEAAEEEAGNIQSVCLVTDLGRINDGTFNQYAYEGMLMAIEEFELESTYIETSAQTDYETNIQTCVDEGYDVVITVGFLIADATSTAAAENPDMYFIGVDQYQEDGPENYVGIQFREDQAGFIVGVLAAQVTESNIVAGVYGIDIPPVVKFRNGFEQGIAYEAANMGKEVETLGVYIDDFVAPDRGASAAEQFMGEGADVIFGAGGPTGTGGILRAAQEGVRVIGVDQDEYFKSFGEGETPGAEHIISSAVKRVDLGVYNLIAALVNDDMDAFPGGSIYILDVANGGISYAPKHDADVDDEFYAHMDEVIEMLISGDLDTGVDPVTGELLEGAAEDMEMEATEEAPAEDMEAEATEEPGS